MWWTERESDSFLSGFNVHQGFLLCEHTNKKGKAEMWGKTNKQIKTKRKQKTKTKNKTLQSGYVLRVQESYSDILVALA